MLALRAVIVIEIIVICKADGRNQGSIVFLCSGNVDCHGEWKAVTPSCGDERSVDGSVRRNGDYNAGDDSVGAGNRRKSC